MDVGNVNKKMRLRKDGIPNWKKALFGKTGEAAEKALIVAGLKKKRAQDARRIVSRRKIKKVTA